MLVVSFNANGIRACSRRGFFDWVKLFSFDVICIQELKAQDVDLVNFELPGYFFYYSVADKKGYSGVGIYTKKKPNNIFYRFGLDFADKEGRFLQIDYTDISIISIYFPSGTSGEDRQQLKYKFMQHAFDFLQKNICKNLIICGDWNIAHKNIDLKNWRSNQKNSGFLPKERDWLSSCFDLGYVDAFRIINKSEHQYTWWTYRANARQNNVGWRIDYQIITPSLKGFVKGVDIYNDQVFSDHAPLLIDYDILL